MSGANLTFRREGSSIDTYYAAISAWHANLPKIVDAGGMAVYFVIDDGCLAPAARDPYPRFWMLSERGSFPIQPLPTVFFYEGNMLTIFAGRSLPTELAGHLLRR